jgi:hypothetical protein
LFTVVPEFNPGTRGMVCLTHSGDLRKESPTGMSPHEHAVDLGVFLDFEGGLALCESCVIEMASMLGMHSADEVAKMLSEAVALHDWEAAHRENAERDLKNALDAVRVLHLLPAMVQEPASEPVPEPEETIKRGPGRPTKASK